MSAAINFFAGQDFTIDNLSGSGLGFYGDGGFGASVSVGAYQGRTFITNSAGTSQGPEVNNVKYHNSGSGILGQAGSGIGLQAVPNYLSTLKISFTNDSAVKVQNAKIYCYDRSSINNGPTGVTCKMAELIHPSITQIGNGSGDGTWITPVGSSVVLDLANSPGTSGQYAANGSTSLWSDTRHDWYVAISASPNSIGSKDKFGLYVSLEYY